jgi:hypothetical protein
VALIDEAPGLMLKTEGLQMTKLGMTQVRTHEIFLVGGQTSQTFSFY